MTITIHALLFAILYSIKGGWHAPLRHRYARAIGIPFADDGKPDPQGWRQYLAYQITDGKVLSSILLFMAVPFLTAEYVGMVAGGAKYVFRDGWIMLSLLCAVAWALGVSPRIKEECASVGGYRGHELFYLDRMFWVKKAVQRGIFTAAPLAIVLATMIGANPAPLLIAGATFPIVYFLGISIYQYRSNTVGIGWGYAEPLYGLALGLGFGLSL
ncbi:putative membrane protein [Micavibrio aeruginosavorus ARL-13]|uniref:Putative membrane protein n=2 Tax=Micavibrio aeruginosavorus TaxID=349221 RepID=G2KLQ1_MICAA|nr:putative membrane protein [Micavibrio aeruginosavorus ARL-13]